MSDEVNPINQTSGDSVGEEDTNGGDPCVCRIGDTIFSTSKDYCLSNGGIIESDGVKMEQDIGPEPWLLPYRLPSGNEVVGSYKDFLADNGTLVCTVELTEADLSKIGPTELVVCKLPSGLGIVETYSECLGDGGTVVGKIFGPIP